MNTQENNLSNANSLKEPQEGSVTDQKRNVLYFHAAH